MKKHFNITIKKAQKYGVSGFVKNQPPNLYMEVEGEQAALDNFISWCEKGPLWARVDKVEAHEAKLKNFEDFTIE